MPKLREVAGVSKLFLSLPPSVAPTMATMERNSPVFGSWFDMVQEGLCSSNATIVVVVVIVITGGLVVCRP